MKKMSTPILRVAEETAYQSLVSLTTIHSSICRQEARAFFLWNMIYSDELQALHLSSLFLFDLAWGDKFSC
jgi:hypothetical protein